MSQAEAASPLVTQLTNTTVSKRQKHQKIKPTKYPSLSPRCLHDSSQVRHQEPVSAQEAPITGRLLGLQHPCLDSDVDSLNHHLSELEHFQGPCPALLYLISSPSNRTRKAKKTQQSGRSEGCLSRRPQALPNKDITLTVTDWPGT